VSGVNVAHERKVNAVLERNQKELAAYLARARGPGESSMKVKLRPRPSGEAARVVFTNTMLRSRRAHPTSARCRTAATGRKAHRRSSTS